MPATTDRYWTPADVLSEFAESTSTRYECIHGTLFVTPAPRLVHTVAQQRLAAALSTAIEPDALLSRVVVALADLRLTADALVQPDLFVLRSPLSAGTRLDDARDVLLVVEVLSPSTATRDRGIKRRFYQRAGIAEYWVVDLESRVVERWHPDDTRPEVLHDVLTWFDAATGTECQLNLTAFFEQVCGGPGEETDAL